MTTGVYHSADFDGIFCREILRRAVPDIKLVGWTFGNKPREPITQGDVYIVDLPVDAVFGCKFEDGKATWEDEEKTPPSWQRAFTEMLPRLRWIDHHKSSIASHPMSICGLRIDGVAACRLLWNYFHATGEPCSKWYYDSRMVTEPLAVRLAGEYDVFKLDDPRAEQMQLGLRAINYSSYGNALWNDLLSGTCNDLLGPTLYDILSKGECLKGIRDRAYAEIIDMQGFDVMFEGFNFLACNSNELEIRSQLFTAGLKPHHQGCIGFTWANEGWRVSLYGVPDGTVDMSEIAKKYGGGGHFGAAGFRCRELPFKLQ